MIKLFLLSTICISLSYGCHDYHHRRKRQINEDDEIMKIERTRYLRNYFAACMDNKTSDSLSWRSVLDFTILDTNWYFNSDQDYCSDLENRDTVACWKSRLPSLINEQSSLITFARECIDEYISAYPTPNCTNGRWTRFFNDDRPDGNGDYEDLGGKLRRYNSNIICRNPTAVDIHLANGADYRTAGQSLRYGPKIGVTCVNAKQINRTQCLDYMVRFCCPNPQVPRVPIIKRQTESTFASTTRENRMYRRCLSRSITLQPNRRNVNYSSLIMLAENDLVCSSSNGSDCIIRVNGTENSNLLRGAWSYILGGISRPQSVLSGGIASCNAEVFPPQLVIDRINSGGRGWTSWSPWGNCPARRCNEYGERLRRRQCVGGPHRIYPCLGSIHSSEPCSPPHCGQWTNWSQWTECPNSRPNSYRTRRRSCINALPGSEGCPDSDLERESCAPEPDRIDPHINQSPWAVFGPCQGNCGRNRASEPIQRFCRTGGNGSPGCAPPYQSTQSCTRLCAQWGSWIINSPCSVSCGSGIRSRHRICNGGEVGEDGCIGPISDTISCNPGSCSTSLSITAESQRCASRDQSNIENGRKCHQKCLSDSECKGRRRRCLCDGACGMSCVIPEWSCGELEGIENGGVSSTGMNFGHVATYFCNEGFQLNGWSQRSCLSDRNWSRTAPSCEEPDGWSNWGPWEQCQGRCNQRSTQIQRRSCTIGYIGGPTCPGSNTNSRQCTLQCGTWGSWVINSQCSVTCGSGTQSRHRGCTGGRVGGPGCEGSGTDSIPCEASRQCPNQGGNGWSNWGNWEQCHGQCNQASTQSRRRFCTMGHVGGPNCRGSDVDTQACENRCGTWSNWTPFTECAGICGTSTMTRSRTCNGGVIGQPDCYGRSSESRQCYTGRHC